MVGKVCVCVCVCVCVWWGWGVSKAKRGLGGWVGQPRDHCGEWFGNRNYVAEEKRLPDKSTHCLDILGCWKYRDHNHIAIRNIEIEQVDATYSDHTKMLEKLVTRNSGANLPLLM